MMYSRLPEDNMFSKTVFLLFRLSKQAKEEDCRGEFVHVDLRRQYHCAAYNTLIATISCTQTDVKFYNGLLFGENLAKVSDFFVFPPSQNQGKVPPK